MGRKALPVRLPTPEEEQAAIAAAVDFDLDSHLRATAVVAAFNANLPKGGRELAPIPAEYVFKRRDRETVSIAMHAAFELIGGAPRLVHWANENPDKFYTQMYVKMLPSNQETSQGGTTINVMTSIPPSPLDNVTISEDGSVVDIDFDEDLPD